MIAAPTIAIVDDDADSRATYAGSAEIAGFKPYCCERGFRRVEEVLDEANEHRARFALCDHRLTEGHYARFTGAEVVARFYDDGNAAVLNDVRGIVVFDTGKKGPALLEFLRENGIREIESLVLSHADDDHIGNAASLLLDRDFRVKRILFNSDPTKATDSVQQLQLAICDARRHRGTRADSQLNTSVTGELDCGDVHIEVLYPPPEALLTGVGGRNARGRRNQSNSLSAAIRLTCRGRGAVLLAGDVGTECLDFVDAEKSTANADVLVFPHHGGAPGGSLPGRFAARVMRLVTPKYVVFSIHRERFRLPRKEVIDAILKVYSAVKFVCTQLPDRLIPEVKRGGVWGQHRCVQAGSPGWWDGNILFTIGGGSVQVGPYAKKGKRGRRTRR